MKLSWAGPKAIVELIAATTAKTGLTVRCELDEDLLQLCQFEAARALLGVGAARIYLAGRERGEAETALRDAGVAEVICAGGDALGILGDALAVALGELQS